MSNTDPSHEPVIEDKNPVTKHDESKKENGRPEKRTEVIVKLLPCPNCNDGTTKKTKDSYKWLKAIWAVVPILVSLCAVIVSSDSRDAAQRSANAAEKSAAATQQNATTAGVALLAATERDRRVLLNLLGLLHIGGTGPGRFSGFVTGLALLPFG